MTRITIDPGELLATAETLRGCAAESAAVGSSLASCAQCAMPPDIQYIVDRVAVTADRLLAEIGARIGSHATDLVNRAQIAANDSLVGANQASAPAGWVGSSAQNLLGGTSTIGGPGAPAFTIAGTSVTSVQELLGGTSTIGGDVAPAFTGGPPPEALAMTATLGGVVSTSGDTRSLMEAIQGPTAVGGYATYDIAGGGALMQLHGDLNQRMQNRVAAVLRDPNSSVDQKAFALGQLNRAVAVNSHTLAPSESDLAASLGYWPTDSQIEAVSPHTVGEYVT